MSNPTNKYITPVGLQQPAAADLSDGTTGSGAIVLASSPALINIPTAPTAALGTNTTQLATTQFVLANSTTPTAPLIRGTGIQASSAASYTVNWPAGSLAGDMAVIMVGGGFQVSPFPTGWTIADNQTGTNWEGSVFYRVLSTADISTGHVIVAMGGTFDTVLGIVTFQSYTAGIRPVVSQRNSSGSATITLNSLDAFPSTTDMAIYFGSNRAASTDTISLGTLKQQVNDGANASGAIYAGIPAAIGGVSPVYSYSVAGSGNYQAAIFVKGWF